MELSKIKLSGFKSFVDPTTLSLPGRLVAIVGPNGCGKSNIIDAVTWVMGESSPKYLRGEALSDVIFNGSSTRKPVGQASVELIFDNSDGSIGGEYAKFTEISIKRLLSREADSVYYLNGVRCRKRDVVDLFLGTGIGPRSYSIIGQNMINRVIEAKPEELRIYLEEAAGISKYKERRHETELRIQHTKENLARVNDLHLELSKQLSHLRHQANVAEKYKTLKQEERVLRAELLAIEWRRLDSHMVDYTLNIKREETALEARHAELTKTDREIEQMRHEQRVAQDAFQEVQRRYYSVGNEITRIEQDILHHQERNQQWEADLKQIENDWQLVKNQLQESEDQIKDLAHEIQQIEPQLNTATEEVGSLTHQLQRAEEEMQNWQNQWEEFNEQAAKTMQTSQVEKTHIQYLEQKISSLQKRQEQLRQEQASVNFSQLNKELEDFSKKSYEAADQLQFHNQQLKEIRKEIETLQAAQQDSMSHLDKLRNELQRSLGHQASLEALQQTALGQKDHKASKWIATHHLDRNARLAQKIEVEKGWELAVEKVLGFCLQAICVDKLEPFLPHIKDFKSGNLCLLSTAQLSESKVYSKDQKKKNLSLLLEKIKSPWRLDALLGGIYVTENLDQAIGICQSLEDDESIITRDGIWLNRASLKILHAEDPAAGVIEREQELKLLANRIAQFQKSQSELEKNINQRQAQIHEFEKKRDQFQQNLSQQQAQALQINTQQKMKEERLSEIKIQAEHLMREFDDCETQLKNTENDLVKARLIWQEAVKDLEQQSKNREIQLKAREHLRKQLLNFRENTQHKKEKVHELELRLQTALSQKASSHQSTSHLQNQLASLSERKITLQSEITSMQPLETIKKSLSRALDKHVSVEVELNTARVAVESLEQEFRNLEEKRQIIERDINKIRNHLETLRVDLQGWKVKSITIQEQIKETEFKLEDILKTLTQEFTIEEHQQKLDQVVQRINRLGAINLVAIDEYATCSERQQYLEKQLDDLQSGLKTLEEAIAKIDKETKQRFKETFDKVNLCFQELFPKVFGGGRAYLELTDENLLEAGVTTMACPPGKRNSSIYLLSGGEKSLTAIALIFSIFHLNPAPFCLLDEVDAALDDANVLRFTRLVKTMADKTQFIFISHNKVTIEMADHLIGITMSEPGVSRLVSVDVEKAMSMASA